MKVLGSVSRACIVASKVSASDSERGRGAELRSVSLVFSSNLEISLCNSSVAKVKFRSKSFKAISLARAF